jgi:excisionase family DNA binding protein
MYVNAITLSSLALYRHGRAANRSGAMLTRRFLTVKEVADLVQVSEASVRHWIKLQQLRAIDLGREWRVIPRDLEAFLATHATSRAANTLADAVGAPAPIAPQAGEVAPGPPDGLPSPCDLRPGQPPSAPARSVGRGKGKRDAGA